MSLSLPLVLEWSGSLFSLAGAFVLATNTRHSRYGWIAFFLANFLMLGFAIEGSHWGLFTQQVGFTATSVLGMHRSGLLRRRRARSDETIEPRKSQ
ncbi:hypothetical protein [Variovorax saccharolyticus]|uniref:hypothetical protein n=1 Tax=Variovorax saccharolyticus TaxID=3053516 RepID=UPI0025763C15|nr:hypothetical protein [Variovorax sp. J31P216]MDM0029146.1 hypothetical protein [Variovorax sp. J31P216]